MSANSASIYRWAFKCTKEAQYMIPGSNLGYMPFDECVCVRVLAQTV